MDITGNVVFIPGATSGIGEALAVALYERGNMVTVGGRREANLRRIAEAHPGIDTVVIDTASAASIADASAEVLDRHPDLDTVILMAGIMQAENWREAAGFIEIAERTVTTNLLGPIRLIAAFIEHLQRQPRATIMTVSSGLAFTPLRVTPTYNATKAAVHQLSESIRLQLADTAVSVVELVPPAVKTRLMPGHEKTSTPCRWTRSSARYCVSSRTGRTPPRSSSRPSDHCATARFVATTPRPSPCSTVPTRMGGVSDRWRLSVW